MGSNKEASGLSWGESLDMGGSNRGRKQGWGGDGTHWHDRQAAAGAALFLRRQLMRCCWCAGARQQQGAAQSLRRQRGYAAGQQGLPGALRWRALSRCLQVCHIVVPEYCLIGGASYHRRGIYAGAPRLPARRDRLLLGDQASREVTGSGTIR